MGLAGARTKQRFGLDPRNTHWSNNTGRFGHQHLVKLGWKPGNGLGLTNDSLTSHIRINVKNDNLGLGANLAKKKDKADEFDSGENVHLDAFQRLLGRLNGKEDEINKEVDRKRTERILNGRWGVHFVKSDTLCSTWDKNNRKLFKPETTIIDDSTKKNKRKLSDADIEDDSIQGLKKIKKDKSKKKSKDAKREKKEKKSKDKKEKKVKDKKDKKSKKDKKDKKDKKSKKDRKDKEQDKDSDVTRESMLKPKSELSTANVIGSKMALRSKWIRQKRAAVMDEKALQEIFMIK